MPISKSITLREFLDEIAHKTKFNNNDNFFKNADDFKEECNNSNSDNEGYQKKSNFNGLYD